MSAAQSGTKTEPGGRRRAPKGEGSRLRGEILDATETLLVQTGNADSVSIRAIADAVGVTPPSIYRHFDDKDELVNAICERRFADLNATFNVADEFDDPVVRLRELGRAYGRFALEHPEHYRVIMMTTSSREKLKDKSSDESSQGQTAFGRLVAAVHACQEAGRIVSGDPSTIAVVLWSGVHGLVSLLITSPGFPWPADPATLLEGVLDAQMASLLTHD